MVASGANDDASHRGAIGPAPSAPADRTPSAHPHGLNSDEVAARVAAGQGNRTDTRSSRTLGEIVGANVFTRCNAITAALAAVILVFGDARAAMFGLVMVSNAVIGTVQELGGISSLKKSATKEIVKALGAVAISLGARHFDREAS